MNNNKKRKNDYDDEDDQNNDNGLKVENFYEHIKKQTPPNENNPNYKIHGIDIPFRMLVVGASGSMKTNAVLDLCKKFEGTFYLITIVTRNINEPLYEHLRKNTPEEQCKIVEIEDDDLSFLPPLLAEDGKDSTKNKPT